MKNSLIQVFAFALGLTLALRAARQYLNAGTKRVEDERQLQSWEDEGGNPAPEATA